MKEISARLVLVTAPYLLPTLDEYRPIFAACGCQIRVPDGEVHERLGETEMTKLLQGVEAAIVGGDALTAGVLSGANDLKVIHKWGTGVDNIDRVAADLLGIRVLNTPNAFTDPVADTVLGFVLSFARRIHDNADNMRRGIWQKLRGASLSELSLGVVGYGNIGRAVAARAQSFGMTVRATDISASALQCARSDNIPILSLDDLVRASDFVSLHCDLNPSSFHVIAAPQLREMKPTAVLINTSRGCVIDQEALIEHLLAGAIAGAALDVFEHEPLPEQSPLRQMQNVLLSPHASNSSPRCWKAVHEITIKNTLKAIGIGTVDEAFAQLGKQ